MALAMIFSAVSCQQENFEPVGEETTVSFTVSLPDAQTKTKSLMGEVSKVDELIYEVWKTEAADERDLTDKAKAIRLYQKSVDLNKETQSTVITLNLVQDQEYTVLFWAQDKDADVYVTDSLTNVHYAKGWNGEENQNRLYSNQENYEAYYAAEFVSDEDSKSRRVELKRPFAQLNLGTKNTQEEIDHEYGVRVVTSKVVIDKVGTSFNVAQNSQIAVSGEATVTFDTAVDPSGEFEKFTVNGQEYEYVAMNYLFATGNTATVSYVINTELTGTEGTVTDAQITNTVYEVPLQENYRTNIVGNLLTSTTEYIVVVNPIWSGDLGLEEIYYYAENGGVYNMTRDIVLTSPLIVKKDLVINLNGFTITGGDEYTGVNQTGADISAITVDEDATLTIQGVGKVIGGTYAINAVKGTVNISGGNFFAPYTAVQLRAATLNITGGRFEVTELQSGMYYVINCVDSNWNNGTAILNITGGSFKNFDPANAWESLHRVSFVPEGYTTNLVDDMYFVVPVSE